MNYNDDNCRANLEMNDDSARPAISGDMTTLTEYDTVFIGYPIWWGTAPRIIDTFFESYDMSGKTVYTFCTSGGNGSGMGKTNEKLAPSCKGAELLDGEMLNHFDKAQTEKWLKKLNLG